ETRQAPEVNAFAGEEVCLPGAVLRDKVRLDARLTLLKHNLDLAGDTLPIGPSEKIQRRPAYALSVGVARGPREIPIPPQNPSVLVIQIENPGRAFDHRVGKPLL